jgi:hypothetical protein
LKRAANDDAVQARLPRALPSNRRLATMAKTLRRFGNSAPRYRCLWIRIAKANLHRMSLAEIGSGQAEPRRTREARGLHSPSGQARLDEQIEEDFAPGGKRAAALERIDAEIDALRVQ